MAEIDTRWRGERRVVVTVETTRPQIYVTAVGAQGLAGPPGPIGPEGPKGDPTGVWVRGGLPPLPEPPPDYNPLWVDLDDDEDSSWTDIYPQLDLRIGTVAESATQASAEIVGEAPDKILNLVLRTGSEGASAGVLTSKGDLLSRDASKAVRVPVGSAGQVLTADPAAAAGVAWQGVRRGEWEQVATWAALPASGSWPGRRFAVQDGLKAAGAVGLVAVWDGAGWQVDPVSDTGWWSVVDTKTAGAIGVRGWRANVYGQRTSFRLRRRGSSVQANAWEMYPPTSMVVNDCGNGAPEDGGIIAIDPGWRSDGYAFVGWSAPAGFGLWNYNQYSVENVMAPMFPAYGNATLPVQGWDSPNVLTVGRPVAPLRYPTAAAEPALQLSFALAWVCTDLWPTQPPTYYA